MKQTDVSTEPRITSPPLKAEQSIDFLCSLASLWIIILAAANAMLGVVECLQCQLSTIFWARGNWRQWPPSSHRKLTCDWLRFSGFNSSSISEMIGGFLGLPRLSSGMLSSLSDSSLWSSWWLLSEGKYSISSILVGSGSCKADREMSSFFLGNRKIKFYWNNTI